MTQDQEQPPRQDGAFPDAGSIVDAFGGVRPMAARLGVAATTIQGWKSRGNIPDARRDEVRDAARAAGIDLSRIDPAPQTAPPAAASDSDMPDAPPTPPTPPVARPSQRIAWLALALAVVAGVAVAVQSTRTPPQTADLSGLVARVAALEAKPAPKLASLAPLTARIEALESTAEALRAAAARPAPPAPPDPAPRLDALAAQNDRLREALGAVERRLETLSVTAQKAGQSQIMARAAELDALRAELAALRTRLESPSGGDASAASLVLAVATLEAAVNSGAPFKAPLAVIERFAGQDPALAAPVAALAPFADKGVATRARLIRDFDAIAGQLSTPLWPVTGVGWVDGMLAKIDTLVTIRRLEDTDGKPAPAVRAERALAAGDLPGAVAALAGAPGPGAAWAARVQARIAADRAVAGLRLRAIAVLGAGQPAATPQ